ncbi:MAG: hypothetical protein AAB605_03310 [Patescibacteria group bacterium]
MVLLNEPGLSDLDDILDEVEHVFPRALQLIGDSARTGAVLTVVGLDSASPFEFRTMIGTPAPKKRQRYWELSLEKAKRLLMHPDHNSSFESRNEAEHKYGGAIRARTCIVSLSGLPEKWDEAVVLVLASEAFAMNEKDAELIAKANDNPHFEELLDEV